jgi:ABC-type transport system involved in multi-copper enzyme maturation permease subunit
VGNTGSSAFMIVFPSLDIITIVQVILSLLALLFSYDTISGEKEHGTLAQVLSNPVPRHNILLGKFLGGMMSISLPLMVGLLAGLIVVWFSGDVTLKAGDWVRLGLVVLASLLYISVFFTLGVLISGLTGRSATALVFLLFLWVFFVTIIPNMGPYLAKQLRPIRDRGVVDNQAGALDSEMWDKLNAYSEKLHREGMFPPTLWTYQSGGIHSGHLPYAYYIQYTPKENLRWYLAGIKYRIPLELQYADKIWELYQEYDRNTDRQRSLARLLSRISPAWTYYNASSILSGTDVESYLGFMDQARKYRQTLIDYAQSNGGFATLLYFTRMTMDDAPTTEEAREIFNRIGQNGFEKKMMEYKKNVKPFDGMPVFQYKPDVVENLLNALTDLAILAILNAILFMIAYVSFMRGKVK